MCNPGPTLISKISYFLLNPLLPSYIYPTTLTNHIFLSQKSDLLSLSKICFTTSLYLNRNTNPIFHLHLSTVIISSIIIFVFTFLSLIFSSSSFTHHLQTPTEIQTLFFIHHIYSSSFSHQLVRITIFFSYKSR